MPYVYTSLTQDFALNPKAPTAAPSSSSASAPQGKEQAPSYRKSSMLFHLYALQGGKSIYPSNGELRLKREPFSLVFMIKQGKSGCVYVNFSASSAQYDKARDLMPFDDLIPEGCGFADSPGNKDRYAILDNFGWHVWDTTFSEPEFIRFDKHYEEDGFVHAERGINKFYDLKNECDLSLSDAPTIYMTIVEEGKASDGAQIIANLDKAKLVFADE